VWFVEACFYKLRRTKDDIQSAEGKCRLSLGGISKSKAQKKDKIVVFPRAMAKVS
jgi:hypothetical protein